MKDIGTDRKTLVALGLAAAMASAACSVGADDPAPPAGPQGPDIQSGAYLPDDGLLVIELESGAAAGDWSEEVALAGYMGVSYLRWDGPNLFNAPGQDTFGFDFWIDDPGVYQFRIHNRHDHPDSTMANDVFVRLDGGAWIKVFSSVRGVWTWASRHEFSSSNKPEAEYNLTAGNHTLEFSGRSFDFSLDRFHLYDTGVANPLDTSHPESSQFSSSGATSGFGPGESDGARTAAAVSAAPLRRLVLGPVVARRVDDEDAVLSWERALKNEAHAGVARTVDVAVVGANPDWSNDLDPHAMAPDLERLLLDLPGRWREQPELRWTFESSPSVVPATLDDLARLIRANDPEARPLVLRVTPAQLVARWPDVLHSSFDGIVVLRTMGDADRILEAALELLERSGRTFDVQVQVGAGGGRDDV